MKIIGTLLLLLLSGASLFPQDTLVLKDGTESLVKIIEIERNIIKYKKHALPDGPLYNIEAEKVFMIFYKGGVRELIKTNFIPLIISAKTNIAAGKATSTITDFIRDEENGWELKLLEQTMATNKNKKWLEYSALINVYKNNSYLTEIRVSCNQHLKKRSPGERIDKSFLYKSFIVFAVRAAKPLENLLYEKYENYGGKGLGWGVGWDFLKQGAGSCSVKHFYTNAEVVDIKFKTDQIEYKLQDCSSIEKRVLSAAIRWLNTNLMNNSVKATR